MRCRRTHGRSTTCWSGPTRSTPGSPSRPPTPPTPASRTPTNMRTTSRPAESGPAICDKPARWTSPPGAVLAAAMAELTGDIAQVPSAVSAIKVDGVRAYARVRAGHEVTLAARPVQVRRFELTERRDTTADGVAVVDLDVVVECSTGTY